MIYFLQKLILQFFIINKLPVFRKANTMSIVLTEFYLLKLLPWKLASIYFHFYEGIVSVLSFLSRLSLPDLMICFQLFPNIVLWPILQCCIPQILLPTHFTHSLGFSTYYTFIQIKCPNFSRLVPNGAFFIRPMIALNF